jgi:hypothetical protein
LASLSRAAPKFDGNAEDYYQFRHGMENFLQRRSLTGALKLEVLASAMIGDASTFLMGVDLPTEVEELWDMLDERFGEPEDARLDALLRCTQKQG